ncbi:glycosyltransferase family 4 protein [Micromonospora polyrhachis]|uniref:Glycosyltransferase involved in cell wall biosynthesis n=1 Tax=Micromonospora polyrhachis TaxID=1282883 RepID=A0A7W7WT35_9ACTN|nr:glycosyltransferase family 4 protein [Micromonospora polyrhachis]MBB4962043.1 glycosyltransferase involved in cell wall biosynthesis [Micromonospora polyrhachis]
MKIGILSYFFPPEPAFIPGSLAEELVARGHEVRVLTGFPDYPGGQLYPGWRQRWKHQTSSERLTVRRVPRYPGHDASATRMMASYLSFAGSVALVAPRYLAGVDVLYVYQPPATTFAAAGLLRLLRQIPTVLHVQELWPETASRSTVAGAGTADRLLHGGLASTVRRIYQAASGIAVIAPSMRELVVSRGADEAKVRVILNWTDERVFRPTTASAAARQAIGHRGRCTVMHAGDMGPFQRVETAVRAAAQVNGQLDLVLVGSGSEEQQARRLAAELGAGNVRFVGPRPPEQMAELYNAAEYQLVLLRDLPTLRGTVPAKLQAALSCGSPVVVSAGGDTADLVERTRVGLSCPPEDWQALADRFALAAVIPAEARAEMSHRARESYLQRMSMRAGVDEVEQMLGEAVARRRGWKPAR